jgi:ABC-type molybdate transport system substrate-binding protein
MPTTRSIRSLAFLLAMGSVATAQVNILASAEFEPALEELRSAYTAVSGVPTHATYGSSGALAHKAATPGTDVYMAGDKSWADSVAKTPRAEGDVLVLATTPLCIWTRGTGVEPDPQLAQLQRENVGRIALADTLKSPDGALAARAMHGLAGWPDIKRRILLLPDPASVADSMAKPLPPPEPDTPAVVDTGKDTSKPGASKPAPKVAKPKPLRIPLTDAFFSQPLLWNTPLAGIGRWVAVDTAMAPPLHPSVVRLKSLNPSRADAAQKFILFLQSPRGRSILRAKGFLPPPQP